MFENLKRFPAFIDREGKKVPIYDDWQKIATNDPNILQQWLQKHNGPNFLWGIPTGEDTGIYALDIDVKNNKDGFRTINKLGLSLPKTVHQRTKSGGYHLIFRYPKGSFLGNRAGILEKESGLDTRGEGGWIVDYGFTQSTEPLIEPPTWLIEAGKKKEVTTYENGSNYTLSPEVATEMIHHILDTIRNAPPGQGNDVLNAQSFEMGRIVTAGAISIEDARRLLVEAATFNGRRGEYEAHATVNSGLEGGLKAPLMCPFDANPKLVIPILDSWLQPTDWTPTETTLDELFDTTKLKQPELFKDWSSCDISLLNAEGGTGKTTLLLYESVCLRLGDRFLGFENMRPNGKTLYITGEDTAGKLKARLGQILTQMNIINDREKVKHILSGVFIKKDGDMCIVIRDKNGVWYPNPEALEKFRQAIIKLKPDKVVIDSLANFWGPESQVNDMSRGVIKFAGKLVEEFNICVEMVHHLGSDASKTKEMGQFSGRGGSVIPSHSRIVKSMRPVADDERDEFINFHMDPHERAILCNIGKFTDGSEFLHRPFLIIRNGFLFKREIIGKKIVPQKSEPGPLVEKEMLEWMISERKAGRYPSKNIIVEQFKMRKVQPDKIRNTIESLKYFGFDGYKINLVEDPSNLESKTKVYVVIDKDGKEVR